MRKVRDNNEKFAKEIFSCNFTNIYLKLFLITKAVEKKWVLCTNQRTSFHMLGIIAKR